tara:strand:- start:56 stop:679 length:624 start_codon:yes stop_codon:yes gene_type:complete
MGTKRVGLARTQALIQNLKRELNLGDGTAFKGAASTDGSGTSLQSGSIDAPSTRIMDINGEVITTITVDLQHLSASGTAARVIGNPTLDTSAHLIVWSDAENGKCTSVELACIETPVAAYGAVAKDIDLVSGDTGEKPFEAVANDASVIAAGGNNVSVNTTLQTLTPTTVTDGKALYLTTGAAPGATGEAKYTAGKLVITLKGRKDF